MRAEAQQLETKSFQDRTPCYVCSRWCLLWTLPLVFLRLQSNLFQDSVLKHDFYCSWLFFDTPTKCATEKNYLEARQCLQTECLFFPYAFCPVLFRDLYSFFFLTNFEVLPIWARKGAFVIVAHFNYTLENERNLNSSKYVCHHRQKRTSEACSFVWSIYLVFRQVTLLGTFYPILKSKELSARSFQYNDKGLFYSAIATKRFLEEVKRTCFGN